jgi:5-methylcytosine-specific restriction enzyme A
MTSQREHDARRKVEQPWRRWYSTARWRNLRKRQLRIEPHCRMCRKEGRLELATVCDHVEPHRGDLVKFWSGPFQSLCTPHHNRDKQSLEKGGKPRQAIGADGWPL